MHLMNDQISEIPVRIEVIPASKNESQPSESDPGTVDQADDNKAEIESKDSELDEDVVEELAQLSPSNFKAFFDKKKL